MGVVMNRKLLFIFVVFLLFSTLLSAFPVPRGFLTGTKALPMRISAMAFSESKLYIVYAKTNKLAVYDLATKSWQDLNLPLPPKLSVADIFLEGENIHFLDDKENAIYSYSLSGKSLGSIQTKGVPELSFKGAKRLLVNYQGFYYVLDSTSIYAFSKEGMLIGNVALSAPVSMTLGEDQQIRVLQKDGRGSEVLEFNQFLGNSDRFKLINPGSKPNFAIDFCINYRGEMHIINSSPLGLEKLTIRGKQIPNTRFGSESKARQEGSFLSPTIIKCGSYAGNPLFAVYDSKKEAIQLFSDTEASTDLVLKKPPYTIRPSLEEVDKPLSSEYLALENKIVSITNLPYDGGKAKPEPAIVCEDRDGHRLYTVFLRNLKELKVKSFTALASSGEKLYVLDGAASMIHILNVENGSFVKSFSRKGSYEGGLNSPSSLVVGADDLLYVADTGNRRISVFNEYELFVKNFSLKDAKQKPLLLRRSGNEIYCLSDSGEIYRIPLKDPRFMSVVTELKGANSFDFIMDGKLALLDNKRQKLMIYKGSTLEQEYFSRSSTGAFPHFADISFVRFDPFEQKMAVMDEKVGKLRYLHFFAALEGQQEIRMALDHNMKVELSWDVAKGINRWVLFIDDGQKEKEIDLNEPKFTIEEPKAKLCSYRISPVANDGIRGKKSEAVVDYYSYALYLYEKGEFAEALKILKDPKNKFVNSKTQLLAQNIHIAQAKRLKDSGKYSEALRSLAEAAKERETTAEIVSLNLELYKVMHEYRQGLNYLHGLDYENDAELLKEYIGFNYLLNVYSEVIRNSLLYNRTFAKDEMVSRYLASAYEANGNDTEALAIFRELVEAKPTFSDEMMIAQLLLKLNRFQDAERQLQGMLSKYNREAIDSVRNLLGDTKMKMGNYGEAIDHYLEAIKKNPNVAQYHNSLGNAYLKTGNPQEAKKSLRKAYEMAGNVKNGMDYALVLKQENELDTALAVMEKLSSETDPDELMAEFYVLYADVLSYLERFKEAMAEITKAKNMKPEDREINQRFVDIRTQLQVQALSKEIVEFIKMDFKPIFPSLNEYYKTKPIGSVTLLNNREQSINNLKMTVFVHEVGARVMEIDIPILVPKQERLVNIPMDFKESLFDKPRKVPVEIKLLFEFEGQEHNPTAPNITLDILSSKAMDWGQRRSIASFVNPQDEHLNYFIRQNIISPFGSEEPGVLSTNIVRALQIYSFYRANNIVYSHDSSASNLDQSALDEVQFPHQILTNKAGDCEDLLVLLASSMESVGVPTAFIDVPGHVMLAISSGMDRAELERQGFSIEYFIEKGSGFWLPLETTLMGKADFVSAWLTANRHYQSVRDGGITPEVIEFSEAHRLYPPSSFTKPISNAFYKNINDARAFYNSDKEKMLNLGVVNRELEFQAALAKYPKNQTLRLQYARFQLEIGKKNVAESLYNEVLNSDPSNFAALINLGNLLVEKGDAEGARAKYLAALKVAGDKSDQVYRNLCLLEYRQNRRDKALEYFSLMSHKELMREVDASLFVDLNQKED